MSMRFILAAMLACADTGCVDHCVTGESKCSGDHILACGGVEGDEFRDLVAGCGDDRCLDIEDDGLRVAVCSTTGTRDPRCADEPTRTRTCVDDTTLLRCNRGFSWAEEPCAGQCRVLDGLTLCTADTGPSAACTQNGASCEGGAAITCRGGWAVDRMPCGDGERCMASPFTLFGGARVTYCASEATTCDGTEVRCTSSMRLAGCVDGHDVEMACSPRYECDTFTVLATGTHEAACSYR
jgi:hypothetical protein